jgi:hypothetical protein
MADKVQKDVFLKIIKKASKEGIKSGLIKGEIKENVADGLADQYAFTYELLSKGYKITPEKLGVALIEKGIGIAKMGSSNEQYQCGISVALVGVGFFKAFRSAAAAAASDGVLTPLLVCDTADLLDKMYKMDKKCGISDAVEKAVFEKTSPAYMWFEEGITKWIGSQMMTGAIGI